MADYDSDGPEEFTSEQGMQQDEEIRKVQKENKARVVREGKERRRQWAQNLTPRSLPKKEITEHEMENETREESLVNKGMLPDDIVKLLAEREKKVFSSDSEDEKVEKKSKRRKTRKSGLEPVVLKDIPAAQCVENSLEFLKKRKMQVSRSSAVLNNSNQALRLLSKSGLLNNHPLHFLSLESNVNAISNKHPRGRALMMNNSDSSPQKRATFSSWLQSDPFLFRGAGQRSFRYLPAPSLESHHHTRLLGSLIRKEGHIYSLAASGDLLYTGSESKSIRVWKNQKEFSGFKSNSGLVKAIIISGERIFSGHQDGKIRIWKASRKDPTFHKRVGTMPTLRSMIKISFNPSIHNRKAHNDAISCLSLSEDKSLLYSASWDKTFKVWRISDSKCLESVTAHHDAVNALVAACDGYVFTGSADGTVKVWRRQVVGRKTKHILTQTLLNQECAVTALTVDPSGRFLYCGSSDGFVNYWECGTFLCHGGVLRGHKLAVLCLATVGELALSGSADTNVCVWRRDGGEHVCLSVLTGHSGPVKCLAAEEGDKEDDMGAYWRIGGGRNYTVYSGSSDKSVKIWKVTQVPRAPPRLPSRPYRQMADFLYGASTCKIAATEQDHARPLFNQAS
ncbi:hypothetical protein AAHA92_05745 [Salvia divinorum]|uniref:Uncharacterized protein n=1 Tax=Salvia divinorum TaxID=28513 RepID=A0ABD1I6Y7_SALDI